jgi:hypothetical protein
MGQRVVPDLESVLPALGKSASKVQGRFETDRRNNVGVDLTVGMDLKHLLRIVGSRSDGRERFTGPTFATWAEWELSLNSLRNAVMHPVKVFLSPDRTVPELLRLETSLRTVLGRRARRK